MNYTIRKAQHFDLPRILEIYAQARAFMAERGNPDQWGNSHPAHRVLETDIEKGNLYILCDSGVIHGVFAFLTGEDPTYAKIDCGSWHYDAPYGTIHRIAGDGSSGIFHACIGWCEQQIDHLRVDTHEKNLPMQRAIAREGFEYCGIIYTSEHHPRLAFDRKKRCTG